MLRLRIRGRVQGVGFRAWTVRQARSLGLRGWVRNRSDDSVEMVAAGPSEALDTFVATCRVGPRGARVDSVDVDYAAEIVGDRFEQIATL